MSNQLSNEPRSSLFQSARFGLTVLTGICLLNYMDRYIVASLVSDLTSPAPAGLGLSHGQAGWLSSSFVIVYLLSSPIFGSLADRRSRPRLIAAGVVIWSIASLGGAFAGSFAVLLASRSLVGIGEAAYATAAPAMLADAFPKHQRGRVFSIFYAAIPFGSALGYIVGGLVDEDFGWRAAFLVAGLPGLAVAILAWFLKDPPRTDAEPAAATASSGPGFLASIKGYGHLLKSGDYRAAVLGYAAYTFGMGSLAFWMPQFLEKERGFSVTQTSLEFGSLLAVTGLLGTLLGGWLADWLLKRTANAYMWVCGISMLGAAPLLLATLRSESQVVLFSTMALGALLLFMSTAPVNSAIINAVAPKNRAKAMALAILVIHILGDVPGPPLVGYLSDKSSMGNALLLIPAAVFLAGIIWTFAAIRGKRT